MTRTILISLVATLAIACGDDTTTPMNDMTHITPDGTVTGDMAVAPQPDMTSTTPAPPTIGAQIDRMGRPAINTAVTDPFDILANKTEDQAKDDYNAAADPTAWVATFSPQFAGNLAIYDAADTVCGNAILACGQPLGCATSCPNGNSDCKNNETCTAGSCVPAAGRYDAEAGVFADDRLWVDTSQTTCAFYLGVEANALGLANTDCGGRTPTEDIADETYTLAIAGVAAYTGGSLITDGISADGDNAPTTTFPFLGAPN